MESLENQGSRAKEEILASWDPKERRAMLALKENLAVLAQEAHLGLKARTERVVLKDHPVFLDKWGLQALKESTEIWVPRVLWDHLACLDLQDTRVLRATKATEENRGYQRRNEGETREATDPWTMEVTVNLDLQVPQDQLVTMALQVRRETEVATDSKAIQEPKEREEITDRWVYRDLSVNPAPEAKMDPQVCRVKRALVDQLVRKESAVI